MKEDELRRGLRFGGWMVAGKGMSLGLALLILAGISCGKREDDVVLATDPKQAASQLDTAFSAANSQVKQSAVTASEALRRGEYEKAIVNLQVMRESQALTMEQGLAIHGTVVSLESQLIRGVEAGDPNAIRAYQLLRAMKRN